MNFIKLKSRAKINLTLDVVRRRKDGYHELEMIMQTLQLYDSIYIRETDTGKIELKTNLCYLPVDEKNIAYKAAQIMMEKFNIEKGVYIQITKRIPVAAGLAGGSGNGAAVLKGMKELFGINISTEELMKIGEELGSDVPYCIMEGTAFATGRGEILKRLSPMANAYVVLAKPEAWVSTAFVYNNLNIPEINKHPDTKKALEAIENKDYLGICNCLENVLESVTMHNKPIIREIKDCLKNCGADGVLMSGSGPTVFALFKNKEDAKNAMCKVKKAFKIDEVILTEIYNPIEF